MASFTLGSPSSTGVSATPASTASATPVDDLVWPSKTVALGPISTGITTRGIYDVLVMGAAILFFLIGIYILIRPDISKIVKQATGTIVTAAKDGAVVGA